MKKKKSVVFNFFALIAFAIEMAMVLYALGEFVFWGEAIDKWPFWGRLIIGCFWSGMMIWGCAHYYSEKMFKESEAID